MDPPKAYTRVFEVLRPIPIPIDSFYGEVAWSNPNIFKSLLKF